MSDTSRGLISISMAAALAVALASCQRAAEEKKVAPPAPAAWTLDESKLQQPIRFAATDLDASQSACKDLSAYVNGKWLSSNAIPADESGWGAALVLNNRSLGVRHQLAEHIATEPNATGIDKIIGDFWATGMDDKKLNELGLAPLKDRLAAIDALTDGPSVAEHLRTISAIGENPLFGFGPQPDFKDSRRTSRRLSRVAWACPTQPITRWRTRSRFGTPTRNTSQSYSSFQARLPRRPQSRPHPCWPSRRDWRRYPSPMSSCRATRSCTTTR